MKSKILETERLIIRTFTEGDLPIIHRILDEAFGEGKLSGDATALEERRSWLQWSILNQEWFANMLQFPYGDRAVALKSTGELIGSVGYVPLTAPFGQIPELGSNGNSFFTAEVGLFWVVGAEHRGNGYATEAAQAMIDHAFNNLQLERVIAATEYINTASQAVMRKLNMTLAANPLPEPHWLQVVGVLYNT